MGTLKAGRPKKKVNATTPAIEFELHQFANTLHRIGGNACKWTIKDWLVFYKIHFNTSYARHKHARASYDFFKKHQNILSSPISHTSLEGTVPRSTLSSDDTSSICIDTASEHITEDVRQFYENKTFPDADSNLISGIEDRHEHLSVLPSSITDDASNNHRGPNITNTNARANMSLP